MKASILRVGGSSPGYPRARTAAWEGPLRLLARLLSARKMGRGASVSALAANEERRIERGYGGELPDPRLAQMELLRSRAAGCGTDFPR